MPAEQFESLRVDWCGPRFWRAKATAPSLERATRPVSSQHHPGLLSRSNHPVEKGRTNGRLQPVFWGLPADDTPGGAGKKPHRKLCLVLWHSQACDSRITGGFKSGCARLRSLAVRVKQGWDY